MNIINWFKGLNKAAQIGLTAGTATVATGSVVVLTPKYVTYECYEVDGVSPAFGGEPEVKYKYHSSYDQWYLYITRKVYDLDEDGKAVIDNGKTESEWIKLSDNYKNAEDHIKAIERDTRGNTCKLK